MPARKLAPLPQSAAFILSRDQNVHALIGTAGRVLLDRGLPCWRVIEFLAAARQAARVDDDLALAVLAEAGFTVARPGARG